MDSAERKTEESFTERLVRHWEALGVEPAEWGAAWVIQFGKFLSPRRYYQATQSDVEAFLPE